jgi:hypothetical protein
MLLDKFDLNDFAFYQSELFRPFIDCYLNSVKKHKYKLFNGYIFQYTKLSELFKERVYIDESYCLPDGRLNLKLKKVKRDFVEHNIVYFIGYTYELNPLFIRVHKYDEDLYDFTGFMQGTNNLQYDYLTSDCKLINLQLKNYPIRKIPYSEWDPMNNNTMVNPIWLLSEKTKQYVNEG